MGETKLLLPPPPPPVSEREESARERSSCEGGLPAAAEPAGLPGSDAHAPPRSEPLTLSTLTWRCEAIRSSWSGPKVWRASTSRRDCTEREREVSKGRRTMPARVFVSCSSATGFPCGWKATGFVMQERIG